MAPLTASETALQFAVFTGEALLLASLVLALFSVRRWFGLSPLYVALGVMQPLQVELASTVYAQLLPGITVSPGSAVMFTCSLFAVLLVYIREDANEARKLIYGLVAANFTVAMLYAITNAHLSLPGTITPRDIPPGAYSANARVMFAGTVVLFADSILLVLVFESLRALSRRGWLALRVFLALGAVLAFDGIAFAITAFLGTPLFRTVLIAGVVGKLLFAFQYTLMMAAYLKFCERGKGPLADHLEPMHEIFHLLTYREKYELERESSGRALHRSHERQRAILEATMDGIFALDDDGKIIEANPAAVATFGLERSELIGREFGDTLLAPESQAAFAAMLREDAPRKPESPATAPVSRATAIRADGGLFPIELSLAMTQIGGARSHIISLRDISDRERLQEALLQSQKLEGIGRLAGGIAHDFNNVLTVILGEAEVLEQEVPEDREARRRVRAITASAHRAARLTGQLLAFARRQPIVPAVVDLSETVLGLEEMLQRLLGADITLEMRCASGIHPVLARADQLEQVIVNLAANARDAMPEGGTLRIDTMNVDGRHDPALMDLPYAACVVRDTGVGMSEHQIAHAFEPFFTTKEQGRGTGLGLASSFGIVRQFDGHIELSSKRGVSTTVSFFLPRTQRKAPLEEQEVPAPPSSGSETILLVEDDADVRGLMSDAMRALGYEVQATRTAEDAMGLADDQLRSVELIVTDVIMPRMRGDRLVEAMRRRLGPLRALFVSGYPRDADLSAGDDSWTAFLQKPFTLEQLAQAIRLLLDAPSGSRKNIRAGRDESR